MEPAKSQKRNLNITYIHTLSYGRTLPYHDVTYGTELCIHNMHTHKCIAVTQNRPNSIQVGLTKTI